MAHFALIENGIVREILAVSNDAIDGGDYPASEALGRAMLAESGFTGEYLQCSRSASFRGAYPCIGWVYDAAADMFTAPPDPVPVEPGTTPAS